MFEEVLLKALESQERWKKGKELAAKGNYSVHLDVNVISWYTHFFVYWTVFQDYCWYQEKNEVTFQLLISQAASAFLPCQKKF